VSWGSQRSQGSPFTDFGISGKEDVQGGGRSVRSGDLTGHITVRVAEVIPNGNLVINGNRIITVNDEKQVMEITGIVRPEDVTADNTVLSTLIADAQIKYTGKGAIAEKSHLGLLSRLLSMLSIF
jgi:flagellar L-ring protein precursor FlgH